jgi:hypothetical protein
MPGLDSSRRCGLHFYNQIEWYSFDLGIHGKGLATSRKHKVGLFLQGKKGCVFQKEVVLAPHSFGMVTAPSIEINKDGWENKLACL